MIIFEAYSGKIRENAIEIIRQKVLFYAK